MSAGFSRRAFLACGASLAGVGWAGVLAPRAVAAPTPVTPENLALRRSAFLPLLGQTFRIAHDRGSLTVVLRQISDLKPTVRPGAEDQFSLIFTDPGLRPVLSQGTYAVSHPRRGRIALFVVPVGRRETVQHYQAIIDSRPGPRFHPD
jgi:hypothetical protein